MNKQVIVVIFGGQSNEYEVSLASAYAVLTHIDTTKYEVITVGITRSGDWFLCESDYLSIVEDTWHLTAEKEVMICPNASAHKLLILDNGTVQYRKIDAVFPVLHGKNGEDGTVQGIVQMANIPIIGCDVLSSALCMDKNRAHKLVSVANIAVPKGVVLTMNRRYDEKLETLPMPLFVKPMRAGSSFGISKVSQRSDLEGAINNAFLYDQEVIVEECIEGFEVGCAVLGTKQLVVGSIDEIELVDGFFDYTEKYTLESAKIHMPARIDENLKYRIQETAKIIYQMLGCQVFARVDMFVTPNEEIVFNEVNTIPGFTAHSRYPNMMKGAGWSFFTLVNAIIEEGFKNAKNSV